jgi:hypothetical protein
VSKLRSIAELRAFDGTPEGTLQPTSQKRLGETPCLAIGRWEYLKSKRDSRDSTIHKRLVGIKEIQGVCMAQFMKLMEPGHYCKT